MKTPAGNGSSAICSSCPSNTHSFREGAGIEGCDSEFIIVSVCNRNAPNVYK